MALPTTNDVKERLSLAYVRAVAARCGCFVSATEGADLASCDAILTSARQPRRMLSLQLKARTDVLTRPDEHVAIDLEMKNYDDLRRVDVTAPQLLVVVDLPSDPDEWLRVADEELIMRRCAWWIDLWGEPSVENVATRRITIPANQRFTPDALVTILDAMARIAAEGRRRPLHEH